MNVISNYLLAAIDASVKLAPPEGKRAPFGWETFTVPVANEGPGVRLRWPELAPQDKEARLRVTVALDDREEKLLEAISSRSGEVIATFDLRYAYALQPFEAVLEPSQVRVVTDEGVMLRLRQGTTPLWLFSSTYNAPALLPHLLFESQVDPLAGFYERMLSLDSVQPFGWLEGCVLDGLYDLRSVLPTEQVRSALYRRLQLFTNDKSELIYENPRSEPVDGRIYGIEATLPFAVWAKLWPQHPAFKLARRDWLSRQDTKGSVQDEGVTSAEGAYTVAYPMAVMAKQAGFNELEDLAIKQLRVRKERLVLGNDIYLRAYRDGSYTFRNWARGITWYLLGLIRTLNELKHRNDLDDLFQEARRVGAWVLNYQQQSGLWKCFVDDPLGLDDTSGSAGIAAALALGAKHELLPQEARQGAERAQRSLEAYLTTDGFLTGVTQSNRGGEALQRSDYRVLSQMAMGLMAQLIGALTVPANKDIKY